MSTSASNDRRWIQRVIAEERSAAVALLIAGVVGLVLGAALGTDGVAALLHPVVAGHELDLRWFASDGLLVVFFFVAGLELRHEFTRGSLASWRQATVPIVAAAFGMITPALVFRALAPSTADAAWGVPMATDLPLALALVAVAGRGLPLAFRAFLLSLAIVDDALSIVVIAVAFGGRISPLWCLVTIALLATYARMHRIGGLVSVALALLAWLAMLQTGIHPTVLGVALGLVTSHRTDRLRDRLQPWSGLVAVPLFIATALMITFSTADFDGQLVTAVSIARVVGKPVGITLGALLALRLFRPSSALPMRHYLVAGSVAGLGFSVSMLFADLALPSSTLAATTLAVIVALGTTTVIALASLLGLRRSALSE